MTFDEAYDRLLGLGIESISTDDGRRYIWRCISQCAHLGPAVEIGSAYGGTAALMAFAGAQVISVDNWQCGQLEVCQQNLARLGVTVELRIGRSVDLAATFADESLSYVMVDGWHWEDTPYLDMTLYAPKVKPGGFLLVDAVANGHPDITKGLARWLADEPSARRFRFDADCRRVETCSSAHMQTTLMGFRCVG